MAFVVMVACREGTGPETMLSPDRLVIVSGMDQVSEVMDTTGGKGGAENLLPAPVVLRAQEGDAIGPLVDGVTVELAVADTLCGHPAVESAVPNDAGIVRVDWVRGIRAGACEMVARLVASGEVRDRATIGATLEPGPARWISLVGQPSEPDVEPGDSVHLTDVLAYANDVWGNPIDPSDLEDVGWAWIDRTATTDSPPGPEGSGPWAVVPDFEALGFGLYPVPYVDQGTLFFYVPGLYFWADGRRSLDFSQMQSQSDSVIPPSTS